MLKVNHLSGGYGHAFQLKNISMQVNRGEFFGIIGPNGSGKTTLVKMISRMLPQEAGTIILDGRPISAYRPKDLARKLAVLPQLTEQSFRFTVRETVALGRYAHQTGLFATLTKADDLVIDEVMDYTHITKYSDMTIDQLSGGERQRVFLAQALAQEPEVIILDEPTNHLDLTYQKELLDLLDGWTMERNLTVIAIFHDLNLASLYCDRLMLLQDGQVHICDEPNEVIQQKHIAAVYDTEVESQSHPLIPKLQVMLIPQNSTSEKLRLLYEDYLTVTQEKIVFESPMPLKTVSTSSFNMGNSWYKKFILRQVDGEVENSVKNAFVNSDDMIPCRKERHDAIEMYTRANLLNSVSKKIVEDDFSLLIVTTASANHSVKHSLGNIHIWIFIDGKLTDAAFIQAIVTATEAKVNALQEVDGWNERVQQDGMIDMTDHLLIAVSGEGNAFQSATCSSTLGTTLKTAVYDSTLGALQKITGY